MSNDHEAYVVYDPAEKMYLAQDHTRNYWVKGLDCAVMFDTAESAEMGCEEVMRAGVGTLHICRIAPTRVVQVV
jgi:hypothetical protein